MERDPHVNGNPDADGSPAGDIGTDQHEEETSESVEQTSLHEELEAERQRSAEYLDQAQRARAELVNYRRRTDEELERMKTQAGERIISRLLPVFDDLNRAIETLDDEQRDSPWGEGMLLILKKLWSTLESEGVRPIESLGMPFDPALHEAVSMQEGADGTPVVVQEFQRGYTMGDRVIRPAMVVVGPPGDAEGETGEYDEISENNE